MGTLGSGLQYCKKTKVGRELEKKLGVSVYQLSRGYYEVLGSAELQKVASKIKNAMLQA